jgi:hypothetical protein
MSDKNCTGYYVGYDLEGGSSYQRPCWRLCGCGYLGCPSLDPKAAPPPIVHIRSLDDQPYGSERRCCNDCGVMLWGPSSEAYVESWAEWRSRPDRCCLSESERIAALAKAALEKASSTRNEIL